MKPFGLIVVDKPIGPSSHRVVSLVRKGTGARKVGHAGTLDPRASGVLVLCLGSATRLSEYLSMSSKQYEAVVRFGTATRTFDAEGETVRETGEAPGLSDIEAVLPEFRGEIEQVPPPFSAIKVQGQKAYELARAGEEVDLEPRAVEIHLLEVMGYQPPDLILKIECTAGTYIRSLANDLGERLSTGAHLANLRRTKAGPFSIDEAVSLPELEDGFQTGSWSQHLRPAKDALPELPEIMLGADELEAVHHGKQIPASNATGSARAIGPDGDLVAVLGAVGDGSAWHPKKVFIR
jgi:tRNA pseudouridine55 synthase